MKSKTLLSSSRRDLWRIGSAGLLALAVGTGGALAVDVPLTGVDGTPDPGTPATSLPDPGHGPDRPEPTPTTATLHGHVFYNDRREHGLFGERFDPAGNPGKRCDPDGERDDDTACSVNWLGGRYIVVDVIERDEGFLPTDFNCKREDVVASVTVGRDGSFAATFPVADACRHDNRTEMAVELRMRLRFCGADYCFSMNDSKNRPYTLSSSVASASSPLTVRRGDNLTVTSMFFNTASDPSAPNDYSIAANYYASVVDTILWLHQDNEVPFYNGSHGEVQYIFPSTRSSTATTRGPDEVVISEFQSRPDGGAYAWVNGETPAHEYGHVLMLRAWDGDYGFKGIGISANDSERAESPQIAFKEGWSEFLERAVFEPTKGCDRPSFDDNDETAPKSVAGDGAWWRLNITKALCDWYDTRDDKGEDAPGAGDHVGNGDIYGMWYDLRRMYVDRALYGGHYEDPGLWFCDYVKYHLDVRLAASKVGQAAHDAETARIADMLFNNNLACFLPRPS